MMHKVGLTGGIGSGKSYISKIFQELGVPVYEADPEARRLMQDDDELKTKIGKLFGEQAYAGQSLNRSFISQKVFKDKKLLAALNALVHPAVHEDFLRWADAQKNNFHYVIKEAAVLIESGGNEAMDVNILVIADEATRIERVMKRDELSEEEVRDRISMQMSDAEKKKYADIIIYNEKGSMILQQIVDLHQKLMKKQI